MWPSELRVQNLESLYRGPSLLTRFKERKPEPKKYKLVYDNNVSIVVSENEDIVINFKAYYKNLEIYKNYKVQLDNGTEPKLPESYKKVYENFHMYYYMVIDDKCKVLLEKGEGEWTRVDRDYIVNLMTEILPKLDSHSDFKSVATNPKISSR